MDTGRAGGYRRSFDANTTETTEEGFEAMAGTNERCFDRVRELLADELGGEPEDHASEDLDRTVERLYLNS